MVDEQKEPPDLELVAADFLKEGLPTGMGAFLQDSSKSKPSYMVWGERIRKRWPTQPKD
ncbi:hypothetical protein RchiOBHm_Chr7g0190731 [Rosa chinensis]|uniref:Uncharacterized protein n=1 Tax=Rosa chinensis TaxID=74649 RepID=A0A2P6P532_ROSCH|nr:hypothetical protein RchiOBHm_Chr7g0190731 [Rosa chinensis]